MEYKINEFNITDTKYTDLKGLITCFESSIPLSEVSFINFGPNLMCVKSTEKKNTKTKEDKKILKEQINLILNSINSKEKNDENIFCFSMSNDINKIYIKRFLKQMNELLHKNKNKENNEGIEDVYEIMNFYELISFFSCIKDEYDDEIPLSDYCLSVSIDKNIKYNKLNLIQFNSEYIFNNIINEFNKTNENIKINSKNNIHIFYMLLYNLQINELATYLYCEETKDYFSIFSEEETLDEHAKRFFFINQFKMLKNDKSYKLMTINSEDNSKNKNVENIRYNKSAIKSEYNFYSNLYQKYLKIKKELLISDEDEKKIFGIYFGILLLSELDFIHDDLFINVIKRNYRELKTDDNDNKSLTSLFSTLRNILISDIRFSNLGSNKKGGEKKKILNLLNKLAICLGISESKIFYILLTENTTNKELSFKENIISNEISLFNNIIYFMNILYLKSIHNILDIITSFNKKQKLTVVNIKPKKIINILLMRSNLIHNIIYENYLFQNNSFLTIGDNFIDSNSYVIKQNIKEHLYSNYFQEKKNYIYLKNSLSLNIDKTFPKMNENEDYINSIIKENINFEEILNVYENEICGLLKLINYGENNASVNFNIFDNKNNLNVNHFKVQFSKNISRKNKIEIIDVYNSIEQKNETYIKVTHSFGIFLYDLNQLFNLDNSNKNIYNAMPNIYKEQNIFKFLEYQPNMNNSTSFKYFQEKTNKIINSLNASKKPIYITCLIELNKFNTLTLFDDMKINIIYVYYSNYFNYLLNINDIRKQFSLNNTNFIPKYMKNKDNLAFFKFLTKKFRITVNDYVTDNIKEKKENYISLPKYRSKENRIVYTNINVNYVYAKNKLSNAFGKDKNIALMIYKYNYPKFIQLFCDKISKSKFNYFIYAINGIKAFVKLTKIYKEKLVLSNVRNLITDIIVDNYDIIKEKEESESDNSINPINQQLLPKIDNLDELIFDFNKEALGKMLPKLRSNLVHLKRIWKDYIYDIIYLIKNNTIFYNKECAQLIIEQRMINFQILLFLFHKNYKFINSESIKKFGVLLSQFTKTVSTEVLRLLSELKIEFDIFLSENNGINNNLNELNKNFENITFEKLITKRLEIQNVINQKIKEKEKNFIKINQQKMREKNLENKNFNSNGAEETAIIGKKNKFIFEENINEYDSRNKFKQFTISKKDLYEGRLDNNSRLNKSRKPSARAIESFNTVNRNSNNLLQLTHGNSSLSDAPNTEMNNNQSSEHDAINNKINNNNINNINNNVNKYKYKYSNISLKKSEDNNNNAINSKAIKLNNNENNSYIKNDFSDILNNNLNNINKKYNNTQTRQIKYTSSSQSMNNNNDNNINNMSKENDRNLMNGEVLKNNENNKLRANNIKNEKEKEKVNINMSNRNNDKIKNEDININESNKDDNQKKKMQQNEQDNIINNNYNNTINKNNQIKNKEQDKSNVEDNEFNNKNIKNNKLRAQNNKNNLKEYELANIDTQGNDKNNKNQDERKEKDKDKDKNKNHINNNIFNKLNKQKESLEVSSEENHINYSSNNEKDNNNNNMNNNSDNEINNDSEKNDIEKMYQSPEFTKSNMKKDESNKGFEFNKGNNYSFKNSVKSSKNNLNQNSKSNKDFNQNDKKDVIHKNKNNLINLIKNRDKNKSSKKSSKVNSHKKFSNDKDNYEINNNNKKYISFNENYEENEDNEENENNEDNNNENNLLDLTNYSFLPDEEIQKACQTLSDINEINIEKNNVNNYTTFPFEYKNDNINMVIKEIPIKIKRGISININKIEREKNIRKISAQEDYIPSLKILEKQINQIKKEVKLIYVNDYNEKINLLHFQEPDDEEEINTKLFKMADELNMEFYKDIYEKLDIAKEKLNSLIP